MIALVDVGNARLKWATLDGGTLGNFGWAVLGAQPGTAVASLLNAVVDCSRMLVANVAGAGVAELIDRGCADRGGMPVTYVEAQAAAYGVICGYRDPRRLGVDRWLAMLAVRREWPGTVCVVDAGTALTIDVLGGTGRHYGGLIIPGLRMMADSLAQQTSNIGPTGTGAPPANGLEVFGCNTQEAVARGALLACAALVDRCVRHVTRAEGARPEVILSGGDGEALGPWLESTCRLDAHLVLKGLALVAGAKDR